ncbi:MAG: 50S ribosomal protein L19e [Candidatus Micrarchaeota archaeon]|nr:50S ribosomal protein L19e [Candidatus Micrarchaeota archaeon]MCX8154684.1 50S ribosomal protein L19e [Candidatus Micrarchaeota archaeon]
MNIETFRRLLADIKGVGRNRIKIKPGREVLEILKTSLVTREDVRKRWKEIADIEPAKKHMKTERKKKRGEGSREGKKFSRLSRKRRWMIKVRALRKLVKILKEQGKIDNTMKRILYRKIKGGEIKSKRALMEIVDRKVM